MQQSEDEWKYTGDEESESEHLIEKVRRLGPDAQSILYALITVEGEEETAKRKGVEIDEIQEACNACSLEQDVATHDISVKEGIAELEKRGFINVRGNKICLITKAEHARTIEKGIDFSKYKVL